jgi:hypothetical protein
MNRSIIGTKGTLNTSMSGLIRVYQGVNSVYKSSKIEINPYISKNKSHIDYQNTSTFIEGKEDYKTIIENKGSRCTCNKIA